MSDAKEQYTKEELIEKINNERIMFRAEKERLCRALDVGLATIQDTANLLIARFVRSYGDNIAPDTWTLDLPEPSCPEGKRWAVNVTKPAEKTYRITARLEVIGEGKERTTDKGDGDAGELHAVPDAAE